MRKAKFQVRSIVNTELLPMFIEFVKKEEFTADCMVGSYAYLLDAYLEENEVNIANPDYKWNYGASWYKSTLKKAVKIVYGLELSKKIR